jgi:hypothetical protein
MQVETKMPGMTSADYEQTNKDLRDLARLLTEIQTALEGGVPCESQCQTCKFAIAEIEKFKRASWPHAP